MKKSPSKIKTYRTVTRRYSTNNEGLWFKLRVIKDKLFGRQPKTASRSHRGARKVSYRRKVIAYAATGFVVFAVLVTVVLAAGSKPDSQQPSRTELAQTSPEAAVSASAALPTQTPMVTTPYESVVQGTPEPIEKTAPESTEKSTESPAESTKNSEPTEKPTEEQTSKPTREPEPTEEATPKPTEKPKEKPPEPTPEKEPVATTPPDPTPTPFSVNDYVDDYKVEADAYFNEMGYSSNSYEYKEEEKYLLAQIIEIESRGEPYEGMVAVGNVVMNRVLNRHEFGSTITEVVTSGGFAYEKYKDRTPSPEAIKAANAVLDDEYWVVSQNVYYFNSNMAEGENWSSHVYYTKIGGHCFYTHDYSGRGDGIPPRLFDRTYKWAQFGCKKDERVKRIQYMLGKLDFDVSADGIFGKGTSKALKLFQESKGLEADGVAGPSTIKALIKAFGVDHYYEKYIAD